MDILIILLRVTIIVAVVVSIFIYVNRRWLMRAKCPKCKVRGKFSHLGRSRVLFKPHEDSTYIAEATVKNYCYQCTKHGVYYMSKDPRSEGTKIFMRP